MKIKANNANSPIWKDVYSHSKLPQQLEPLNEIATNLWWVWNHEGAKLFGKIDKQLWKSTEGNPVQLLQSLSHKRMEEILADKELMAEIQKVYADFKAYINVKPDKTQPSVAYFSMEYGLTNVLKIYSGGLGVLAGDYLKEASDSNIDLCAVGFLYRYGYFTQTLSMDGQQIANYEPQNFNALPLTQVLQSNGEPMVLEVPYPGRTVYVHIWKVSVGRVPLYLMDTDIPQNSEWDRSITHQLYGGDWENRMKQEYLLGIGGIMMLNKLGIKKQIYHCNEGHAALINAQRLVDYIQNDGLSFNQALEVVRASALYTVHTPVPAGHDYFDEGLFGRYMGEFPGKLGISWQDFIDMGRENPGSNEKFSMSVFALNTCQEANGVSWLHGKVSQRMFAPVWKGYFPDELHVGYVTNGVHMPTWAATEVKKFYADKLGTKLFEDQSNRKCWEGIQNVSDEEIWNLRMTLKNKLIDYIRVQYKDSWLKNQGDPSKVVSILEKINPNALLIGFGRRFATYKRAHLLFSNLDRLNEIVNNPDRPVQFIFAGKAHPADQAGQDLIKRIVEISKYPQFLGKILFLPNYDMDLARHMVQGVDVWMNTPTRPQEASGTSGEKAAMNGVMHFSVLDGWWVEGYQKDAGWALPMERTYENQEFQNELDAELIYNIIESEIAPAFYERDANGLSDKWAGYIKNTIAKVASNFTSNRMLTDYEDKFYIPMSRRFHRLSDNHYALAAQIAEWKRKVSREWDSVQVDGLILPDKSKQIISLGKSYQGKVVLDLGELSIDDIGVELVAMMKKEEKIEVCFTQEFVPVSFENGKAMYSIEVTPDDPGIFMLGLRIFPKNTLLPHRQDFALVKWV